MISDNEPLVNEYVSVPREMSQLNCAAFVAGIIEGACDGAGFPARVTAHSVGGQGAGGGMLIFFRGVLRMERGEEEGARDAPLGSPLALCLSMFLGLEFQGRC